MRYPLKTTVRKSVNPLFASRFCDLVWRSKWISFFITEISYWIERGSLFKAGVEKYMLISFVMLLFCWYDWGLFIKMDLCRKVAWESCMRNVILKRMGESFRFSTRVVIRIVWVSHDDSTFLSMTTLHHRVIESKSVWWDQSNMQHLPQMLQESHLLSLLSFLSLLRNARWEKIECMRDSETLKAPPLPR